MATETTGSHLLQTPRCGTKGKQHDGPGRDRRAVCEEEEDDEKENGGQQGIEPKKQKFAKRTERR